MQKSKLLIVSVIVSASLMSANAQATVSKKHRPLAPEIQQAQSEQSFSEWFFGLLDF